MLRWVYAYRTVSGDPAELERILLDRAAELLPAPPDDDPEPGADGSRLVRLDLRAAGVPVSKDVRVLAGVALRTGNRTVLPLKWHAEPARHAFPVFEGSVELEALAHTRAQVTVVGSYRPPAGPLGAVIDVVGLGRLAAETAEVVCAAIASGLEAATRGGAHEEPAAPRHAGVLRVADVRSDKPVVLEADLPLRTAALMLFHLDISGAPVTDADGRLLGVLSEADLLPKEATARYGLSRRMAEEDRRRGARTVGEAATRPARVTAPDVSLAEAARAMLDNDVSRLVVVDAGAVAGMVTRHDVIAALLRADREVELAVERALAERELDHIAATVEWGEVTLSGDTRLRSQAGLAWEIASSVDGVISVDVDGVAWEVDDQMPPLLHV